MMGAVLCCALGVQVRDSVTEAIAEVPGTCLKPGMQTVVETLVKDIARDLITVSIRGQSYKQRLGAEIHVFRQCCDLP